MSLSDSLANRVTELEILVTHLQRDMHALHDVVLEQQKQIEMLNGTLKRVDHRLGTLEEGESERDPSEERPPHY